MVVVATAANQSHWQDAVCDGLVSITSSTNTAAAAAEKKIKLDTQIITDSIVAE